MCSECSSTGKHEYERIRISWLQAIYLVLYHLIHEEPETEFFRWKDKICTKFDTYWDVLMLDKQRTLTWHNTIAGCISTNGHLFKSGLEVMKLPGYWTLNEIIKPTIESLHLKKNGRTQSSSKPKTPKRIVSTNTKTPSKAKKAKQSITRAAHSSIKPEYESSFSDSDSSSSESYGSTITDKKRKHSSKPASRSSIQSRHLYSFDSDESNDDLRDQTEKPHSNSESEFWSSETNSENSDSENFHSHKNAINRRKLDELPIAARTHHQNPIKSLEMIKSWVNSDPSLAAKMNMLLDQSDIDTSDHIPNYIF
ncbi:Cysteine-rich protein 2-binding protein [Smittium culicis]|uniref:Cysteine-rich protein 2-binding protein n=1 Tax=Smittium culicis TaxID=133412 RepID=A0A1R1Y245_9FUNG|nr:Cysteine-rich protein 2-binding protein [Smittium culicis]